MTPAILDSSALVQGEKGAAVKLREYPYPFRAALAICSDLDETPSTQAYIDIVRFLNTREETRFGRGVGLEAGNTIYFDMPPGAFAYWNADPRGREALRALIQSGHIDCLHSFGDLATTRAHAARALEELERHRCSLRVWIDHAVAPSNFGADIMCGQGDVKGSAAYHADLTHAAGIEYVWRGRVTSVLGQNSARSLRGIASIHHPIASGVTLLKESAKGALARAGSPKYGPHAANELVWASRLRSGHLIHEFLRSNPFWGGVSARDTADGFGAVVNPHMLDTLITREATSILYTHLGKIRNPEMPLPPSTLRAFRAIADRMSTGALLVTTTRRLLDYVTRRRALLWSAKTIDGTTRIWISSNSREMSPAALAGMTFYVSDAHRAEIAVNEQTLRGIARNAADHTGRPSVSIPWTRLPLPHGI